MAGASPGVALRPRFPGCPHAKEEAVVLGQAVTSLRPTGWVRRASSDMLDVPGVIQLALVVARSVVMIGVAAFAILVLLPTAVAWQATVPI